MPSRAATPARWPLLCWIATATLPTAYVVYAVSRVVAGPPPGRADFVLAGLCAAWILVVLAVVALPVGRVWLRSRRRQLLALLISVALTAALFDVALSVTGIVPSEAEMKRFGLGYRSSTFTLGRLEPNQALEVDDGIRLEVNERGFRGPTIAVPKPAGTMRLAFLGGSQVFDQAGGNWPVEVGRLLSRPDRPVDVVNAGVPSHRTIDSLGKMLTELWLLEPDVYVVCQAWNDVKYFERVGPSVPFRDLFKPDPNTWGREPEGLDRLLCLSAAYRALRMRHVRAVWGAEGSLERPERNEDPQWGERQYRLNLRLICELARATGARVVLCTQPRRPTPETADLAPADGVYRFVWREHDELVRTLERCDAIVREVAASADVPVIDLSAAISGRRELFVDPIHLSPEGSREAARIVAERLEALGVIGSR